MVIRSEASCQGNPSHGRSEIHSEKKAIQKDCNATHRSWNSSKDFCGVNTLIKRMIYRQKDRTSDRLFSFIYLTAVKCLNYLSLCGRKKKTLSSGNIYFHRNKFKRKVLQQIKEALTLSTKIRPYY